MVFFVRVRAGKWLNESVLERYGKRVVCVCVWVWAGVTIRIICIERKFVRKLDVLGISG